LLEKEIWQESSVAEDGQGTIFDYRPGTAYVQPEIRRTFADILTESFTNVLADSLELRQSNKAQKRQAKNIQRKDGQIEMLNIELRTLRSKGVTLGRQIKGTYDIAILHSESAQRASFKSRSAQVELQKERDAQANFETKIEAWKKDKD
jgi:hypothetical protein